MKRSLKILSIILILAFAVVLLTGCGKEKKEALTFDGEEGKITFQVKAGSGYKISTNKDDFRTSRAQGVLIANDFKIEIEFVDDYEYFFESNLDKMKEARKDYDDYKDVTYNGVAGLQYFSSGYNRYEIMLPVANNAKYYLNLSVSGMEDKEESAKAAIANQEVIDILNSMTFEAK